MALSQSSLVHANSGYPESVENGPREEGAEGTSVVTALERGLDILRAFNAGECHAGQPGDRHIAPAAPSPTGTPSPTTLTELRGIPQLTYALPKIRGGRLPVLAAGYAAISRHGRAPSLAVALEKLAHRAQSLNRAGWTRGDPRTPFDDLSRGLQRPLGVALTHDVGTRVRWQNRRWAALTMSRCPTSIRNKQIDAISDPP